MEKVLKVYAEKGKARRRPAAVSDCASVLNREILRDVQVFHAAAGG
jgi:hypothetical protein